MAIRMLTRNLDLRRHLSLRCLGLRLSRMTPVMTWAILGNQCHIVQYRLCSHGYIHTFLFKDGDDEIVETTEVS